ncbi:MAG: toll/interleukin-1 receptor domain-containing protein [Myxococcota bacterium]
MAELPEPHEGMTPREKGELLKRYLVERISVGGLDFSGADLEGADLDGAKLNEVNLASANLTGADLYEAELEGAELRGARLNQAMLDRASLIGANLLEVDLRGASLQGSQLPLANLRWSRLRGAKLEDSNLDRVNLTNLPSVPRSIADVMRMEEAYVNWRTVGRMLTLPDPVHILCRTGMPHVTATYMVDSLRSIDATDLFTMLQSVFLSYGRTDSEFAERLRNELTENGVKTWYFPRDAVPGERIHRSIEGHIASYDRMVLCCSKASLVRPAVLHEVYKVIERERKTFMADILIPVLIDDVFDTGNTVPEWWPAKMGDLYEALQERVAADFREAVYDVAKWNEELGKLLKALRKRPEGAS